MDINYIICMILWYIMHVCLSVAWNGLNNVIMIYCLNTVYHAGFFFALRYLDKEVHGKEDKIWGWWQKPMHNHTSLITFVMMMMMMMVFLFQGLDNVTWETHNVTLRRVSQFFILPTPKKINLFHLARTFRGLLMMQIWCEITLFHNYIFHIRLAWIVQPYVLKHLFDLGTYLYDLGILWYWDLCYADICWSDECFVTTCFRFNLLWQRGVFNLSDDLNWSYSCL